MNGDLAAFLAARLDEDEAEARATADADAEFWADVKGDGTHFARHDPDHALREVAAGRAILNEWVNLRDPGRWPEHPGVASARFAAQNIAAIYSDHPDYQDAWTS